MRRLPDGVLKQVPPPEERTELIGAYHNTCGHFGSRRTAALVLNSYWWHGLQDDVAHLVSGCKKCSRIKASFGTAEPGELPACRCLRPPGATNTSSLLVNTSQHTKHIEAVPIPDKTPECTSYAFLHHVLSRFGACAEVVHDNGGEWDGEMEQSTACELGCQWHIWQLCAACSASKAERSWLAGVPWRARPESPPTVPTLSEVASHQQAGSGNRCHSCTPPAVTAACIDA
jgi:hypothetical protein